MKNYKMVYENLSELANVSGSKAKSEFVKSKILTHKESDLVIRFLLDVTKTTGIGFKKIQKLDNNEYVNNEFENIEQFIDFILVNNTGKEGVILRVIGFINKISENQEQKDFWVKIVTKELSLGFKAKSYNKVNKENPMFDWDIMRGYTFDYDRALKEINKGNFYYLTEKIDGNRLTYCEGELRTRNGLVFNGSQKLKNKLRELFGNNRVIDGEFVYNDIYKQMTSQEIRSKTTSVMSDNKVLDKVDGGLIFKIFDITSTWHFKHNKNGFNYIARRKYMDLIQLNDCDFIKVVPVEFKIENKKQLDKLLQIVKDEYISKGKEGLMMALSSSKYKKGKGYSIMKLKGIYSADLKIVGWNEGKKGGKWEGKFGSFSVELPFYEKNKKGEIKGKFIVDIGTGYSDEFRNKVNENPDDYIGKLIEILFTEISKNKDGGVSLSYGRFIDFREDKDELDVEGCDIIEIDGEEYFTPSK